MRRERREGRRKDIEGEERGERKMRRERREGRRKGVDGGFKKKSIIFQRRPHL